MPYSIFTVSYQKYRKHALQNLIESIDTLQDPEFNHHYIMYCGEQHEDGFQNTDKRTFFYLGEKQYSQFHQLKEMCTRLLERLDLNEMILYIDDDDLLIEPIYKEMSPCVYACWQCGPKNTFYRNHTIPLEKRFYSIHTIPERTEDDQTRYEFSGLYIPFQWFVDYVMNPTNQEMIERPHADLFFRANLHRDHNLEENPSVKVFRNQNIYSRQWNKLIK